MTKKENRTTPLHPHPYYKASYSAICVMITQIFNCDDSGVTYTDFLLIGRELNEDVVSMGWTDPNLREGCKFLRHLIQQSSHLHQKHTHTLEF